MSSSSSIFYVRDQGIYVVGSSEGLFYEGCDNPQTTSSSGYNLMGFLTKIDPADGTRLWSTCTNFKNDSGLGAVAYHAATNRIVAAGISLAPGRAAGAANITVLASASNGANTTYEIATPSAVSTLYLGVGPDNKLYFTTTLANDDGLTYRHGLHINTIDTKNTVTYSLTPEGGDNNTASLVGVAFSPSQEYLYTVGVTSADPDMNWFGQFGFTSGNYQIDSYIFKTPLVCGNHGPQTFLGCSDRAACFDSSVGVITSPLMYVCASATLLVVFLMQTFW